MATATKHISPSLALASPAATPLPCAVPTHRASAVAALIASTPAHDAARPHHDLNHTDGERQRTPLCHQAFAVQGPFLIAQPATAVLERHPRRAEHRKHCSTTSRHRPAAPRRSDRKRTSTPLPNRTDHDNGASTTTSSTTSTGEHRHASLPAPPVLAGHGVPHSRTQRPEPTPALDASPRTPHEHARPYTPLRGL